MVLDNQLPVDKFLFTLTHYLQCPITVRLGEVGEGLDEQVEALVLGRESADSKKFLILRRCFSPWF